MEAKSGLFSRVLKIALLVAGIPTDLERQSLCLRTVKKYRLHCWEESEKIFKLF